MKVSFIPPKTVRKIQAGDEEEQKKNSENDKEIRLERQNIIDAVLVRIMKARKTEKHNFLVEECIH